MTNEEALVELDNIITKHVIEDPDQHEAHHLADDVLCNLLISLGYHDVVKLYNRIEKWYS